MTVRSLHFISSSLVVLEQVFKRTNIHEPLARAR